MLHYRVSRVKNEENLINRNTDILDLFNNHLNQPVIVYDTTN
jgi:hypothetical protein